jgi:Ser/Thr protein kinase RdoA (MazF antagonist)
MPQAWWVRKLQRAEAFLRRFVEANPDYSLDADQPEARGGTNVITYGAFRGQPVVYKYFDFRPRKEHEEESLRLLAPTGLVPRLYPTETDCLIVMDRLRGQTVFLAEKRLSREQMEGLYCQLGRALARIAAAAPARAPTGHGPMATDLNSYEFYCQADLPTLFDVVMERSGTVLAEQEVPQRPVLSRSYLALRENRDAILSYPPFVHMDDVHTHNMMADGPEFTGFIDLEMTRDGNEVLLLAAALAATLDKGSLWHSIRRGYEEERGKPIDSLSLHLARIAAPFSQWIRFMWYWTRDPQELEPGARAWPIRDIKAAVQALENRQF